MFPIKTKINKITIKNGHNLPKKMANSHSLCVVVQNQAAPYYSIEFVKILPPLGCWQDGSVFTEILIV